MATVFIPLKDQDRQSRLYIKRREALNHNNRIGNADSNYFEALNDT